MGIIKFNETIDIWSKELGSFSMNQILARPDGTSWSLGQLYRHIIEESNWYNGQIKISLRDTSYSNITTTEDARILLERGSFEDKRFQGDPSIHENIEQPSNIDQLKADLERLKIDTNELWNKMTKTSDNGKSEHPGLGYLNGSEWVQYSEMHMRHHLKQKERIKLLLYKNNSLM